MDFDIRLLCELEKLCMISLTPEEKIKAQKDIDDIIKYFDRLSELDFDDSGYEIATMENRFRNDIPCRSFCTEDMLSGAINIRDNLFVVDDALKGGDDNEII